MNELQTRTEQELSPEIIKRYICPQATDQEIYMFLQMCKAQNLNPFLREAYLIKYGDEKASMVVGKETFTKRADKLPDCDGMEAGIIVLDNAKNVTYRNGAFIVTGEELLGGWANVYRKGRTHPYRIEVSLKEYERYNKKGELTKAWREMPATMIRKVALVQALREAYPQEFANMLSPEEMPIDSLPEYKIGQELHPPTIPMPQRKSEARPTEPESTPFDDSTDDSTQLTIKNVTTKHGTKNSKPWTKYDITTSDGKIWSTFSETLGIRSQMAMEMNVPISISGHEGQYGWEVEELNVNEFELWTKEKIVDILKSSDDLDILQANWHSLLPHIGKLDSTGKTDCQKIYDEQEKILAEK